MQGDFFQVLRRVQKEERNKSSLSKVDNDFYKQLREYIKDLEQSVASDPFGNEQLLLNNAQRIATEICEQRESKITKAANNNIYRSFLLFKRDNPQFDLLDTTPLNLTEEEETLYFSLMDVLKNHRYRIALDEYAEDSTRDSEEEYDDLDEDEDEAVFVEDSFDQSSQSNEADADSISEDLEDEISDALGESDEVLNRLNEIKNATVVTDEKREHIDKQVANQMYPGQTAEVQSQEDVYVEDDSQFEVQSSVEEPKAEVQSTNQPQVQSNVEEPKIGVQSSVQKPQVEVQSTVQRPKEEVQVEQKKQTKSKGSSSGDINDILKDPDRQFVDLDNIEPDYNDNFYDSIAAGSNYAAPSDDDFDMIFAKPKKPKADDSQVKSGDNQFNQVKSEGNQFNQVGSDEFNKPVSDSGSAPVNKAESIQSDSFNSDSGSLKKAAPAQSDLGFSSGIDVKEGKVSNLDTSSKAIEKPKDNAPKKPIDKTRGGLFTQDEIKNTAVVISENIDEMVGIDGKIYGPFLENDVVIVPNINAQILINNNKATLLRC
ncbi:hypothetical protein [uncultured Methanobrevibacter sp.]|uniref:DNA replication complex subunit Gins51 n=1 Tax=uncultured Methanobrevibacter sp. TaxID=253161 RepID=UPI002600DE49|nr:hypothetical protein [uncultured Methanobrevibacter sp.]